MNRDAITSSRYSPGNLPGELLERLFVAREPLLRDMLDRIASSLTRGSQYFQLLVGPRGAGKTHLLALLRHRLLTEARFAEQRPKLCLAPLNEEEWGVASYLDLLVRVLRAIATQEGDDSLRASIDDLHERHTRAPERSVAHAEDLLTKHVGKRTLVVLCENLDEILRGIGDEGQKRWRASMQQRKHWNVVATTTALSDALQEHNSPFYNFFHIRQLDRLDLAAATALMRRKAEVDGKHDLAELLDTSMGRARLRAIHHLAGGNSRVYVILTEFLTKDSLDALWPAFLRTIDDLTPYYQNRIRQLAPAQRKIVECLCQAVHAIRVKDIAGRCLMSQQTAAKQLSELTRFGYVERSAHGRESFYELTEPLLRICIDVKDNRTRHLRTFVELMRHWFSVGELEDRLKWIDGEQRDRRPVDRVHLEVALAEAKREGTSPHLDHLDAEARLCEERGNFFGANELLEKLVGERGWSFDYVRMAHAQNAMGQKEMAEATLRRGLRKRTEDAPLREALARLLATVGRHDEALEVLDLKPRSLQDRVRIDAARSSILRAIHRVAEATRIDGAIVARRRGVSFAHRSLALERLGRNSDSVAFLEQALALDPQNEFVRELLGWSLLVMGRWQELLANEAEHSTASEWREYSEYRRARALEGLGRNQEAIAVLRGQVARDPESAAARVRLVELLISMHRFDDGLIEAREAQRVAPWNLDVIENFVMLLIAQGSHLEAIEILEAKVARAPGSGILHALYGSALEARHRLDEARTAFITAARLGDGGEWLLKAASRALKQRDWEWVLRLCDALPEASQREFGWSLTRTRALLGMGRTDDALRSVQPFSAQHPDAASLALIVSIVRELPMVSAPLLSAHITSIPTNELRVDWLCDLLLAALHARGPDALAVLIGALRESLAPDDARSLYISVLSMAADLSGRSGYSVSDWERVLPPLLSDFQSVPGHEVFGSALSVVVRYARSRDPVVLLELPRELRDLLTPKLPPPAPALRATTVRTGQTN